MQQGTDLCRAFSASRFASSLPGALPQAVALRTFGADETADQVGKLTVFNVAGNKVRIVEAIHYNRNRIYIRAVLTHEDMTRESGKNDNAKSGRSQNYQRLVLPCRDGLCASLGGRITGSSWLYCID